MQKSIAVQLGRVRRLQKIPLLRAQRRIGKKWRPRYVQPYKFRKVQSFLHSFVADASRSSKKTEREGERERETLSRGENCLDWFMCVRVERRVQKEEEFAAILRLNRCLKDGPKKEFLPRNMRCTCRFSLHLLKIADPDGWWHLRFIRDIQTIITKFHLISNQVWMRHIVRGYILGYIKIKIIFWELFVAGLLFCSNSSLP